jgi:acetylornithine/N-succinyldiaminopimelate aminotransferase
LSSAIVPTYARVDLTFERGDGCWLTTVEGERYLDFGAGIAVVSLGHSHPHLVETLALQGGKLWHTSNLFQMPEGERLAKRLADASFADLVFFANSGAEANEAAIKMARRRHYVDGHGERYRVLTFEGAFHGRTLATIAAGGQAKYMEGFGPKVDGFDQIPITDSAAVEAAITPETAAIMIEPIQGEGGVRVVSPAFLRALREICDRRGLLLIFDEVQTGVGRTGKLFAYENVGVTPDILTSAKGLGGGFPVSACLRRQPAGDGDRQRRARRRARARLPGECRAARASRQTEARRARRRAPPRDRRDSRRGTSYRREDADSARRFRGLRARAKAADDSRRR